MKENAKMSFFEQIKELSNGDLDHDASVKMAEVIAAIKEFGGKGSVTLTLNIAAVPKFGSHALSIKGDVTLKKPVKDYQADLRFAGRDNTLQRDDPDQMQFKDLEKSFNA